MAHWTRAVVSALWLHAANSWAQPPTAQACDCFLPGNRFLWTDRPPVFFSPLLPPFFSFFTSQPHWTWSWKWTHITPACCLCPTFTSAASLTSRMCLSRPRDLKVLWGSRWSWRCIFVWLRQDVITSTARVRTMTTAVMIMMRLLKGLTCSDNKGGRKRRQWVLPFSPALKFFIGEAVYNLAA